MAKETIKNAKRSLEVIVTDMKSASDNYHERMAVLIAEALNAGYSQRQLVDEIKKQKVQIDQKKIAYYGALGSALKFVPKGTINAENVMTSLNSQEIKVSEVKAWGKKVPEVYTKERAKKERGTRKPSGSTKQVSEVDNFKKSLTELTKKAKKLSTSEKALVRDLAIEFVSVLGLVPMGDFDLDVELLDAMQG